MKKLLLVVLAAVGLASCVQTEELAVAGGSTAIAFGDAYVHNATKAGDPSTTTANIEDFDVWAFMDEVDGIVFTDEDVEKNGGVWSYQNTQYWYPNHTYYFAALSPMNTPNITSKTLATGDAAKLGLGEIAFTNVDGTEDLLYAKAKETTPDTATLANQGMDAVKMQFQHLLSKVKFTFQNGFASSLTTVKVTSVKMTAPKAGTIDLAQTDYAAAWELSTTEPDFELAFGDVATTLETTQRASAADERLTIPAAATKEYTVTFDVAVFQANRPAMASQITATISGVALEMGKAYNFTAVINQDVLDLKPIEFTAEVDEWDTPVVEETIGYFVDNYGNYVVASAEGLQAVVAGINEGTIDSDVDIVLSGNIDLSASRSLVSNWTPIGSPEKPFTGTFDGKGFKVSNLVLVEETAAEGKAHVGFFSFAKNATIKDVVFENAYVNIPCLDIDHSQGHIGVVVGTLEGTSLIENVTVQGDIKVEATQSANGASRVAVVAGGNSYGNVTMKNVHVVANEGSYLIANNNTGALAGQLQGKSVFENCSSNIDVTVNKFFAGGIIGLAAGDQLFVNCHTTGDIKVVAGREGRAHDQYRVGGIAGGWADGKNNVCTLVGCSYTGEVSGKNSDGSVAEVLDYWGYVGRGYTLNGCQGSKVVIDGTEFVQKYNTADQAGIYTINGCTPVSTAEEFTDALSAGSSIWLQEDINVTKIDLTTQTNDVVIDANGKTITTASNYGVQVTAGKNITLKNAKVEITVEGDYITYAAGFKIENGDYQGNTITLENCEIRMCNTDWAYPINMPASVKNLNLVIDGCTLEGAIALQCWGDNNKITVTNSKLICNYTTNAMYTSYCVVLQGNDEYKAENNTLDISGCEFSYSGVDNFNSVIKAVSDVSGAGNNTITVVDCTYDNKVTAYQE